MTSFRRRCTQCDRIVDQTVPHPKRDFFASVAPDHLLSTAVFHKVLRLSSAGAGRYGTRTYLGTCGPVVEEPIDDYWLCLEHLIGETI